MKGFRVTGRWKIVLIATGFNLLFEYSLRGIHSLLSRPILAMVLLTIYFTYFTMLEDLIVRFRLGDYHLVVFAFFSGTIYVAFASGIAFTALGSVPLILGINWVGLLFIDLVWWGALQAVMTFYIANRLVPRDWDHRRLSKLGWVVALVVNISMILLLQRGGNVQRGSFAGLAMVVVILVSTAVVFRRILSKTDMPVSIPAFSKSKLMDYLCILTVIVFIVCAVFLKPDSVQTAGAAGANTTSRRVITIWTIVVSLAMLAHRAFSRKPISV